MSRFVRAVVVPILLLAAAPTRAQDTPAPGPPPPAAAPAAPAASEAAPVVRAEPGNLGLFFRFGGLATLDLGGNSQTVNGNFILTEVGLKIVHTSQLVINLHFGTALRLQSPSPGGNAGDVGLAGGGGVEYHFRVWRRISPFIGFDATLGYVNPTGTDNWSIGFGVGPVLGIEYYLADRLSVTAEYMGLIQITYDKTGANTSNTQVGFQTLAGGALILTWYF
jgi:hypothetical protein